MALSPEATTYLFIVFPTVFGIIALFFAIRLILFTHTRIAHTTEHTISENDIDVLLLVSGPLPMAYTIPFDFKDDVLNVRIVKRLSLRYKFLMWLRKAVVTSYYVVCICLLVKVYAFVNDWSTEADPSDWVLPTPLFAAAVATLYVSFALVMQMELRHYTRVSSVNFLTDTKSVARTIVDNGLIGNAGGTVGDLISAIVGTILQPWTISAWLQYTAGTDFFVKKFVIDKTSYLADLEKKAKKKLQPKIEEKRSLLKHNDEGSEAYEHHQRELDGLQIEPTNSRLQILDSRQIDLYTAMYPAKPLAVLFNFLLDVICFAVYFLMRTEYNFIPLALISLDMVFLAYCLRLLWREESFIRVYLTLQGWTAKDYKYKGAERQTLNLTEMETTIGLVRRHLWSEYDVDFDGLV